MSESKVIFHIDLNCFYAACEEAVDSKLLGRPTVVCPIVNNHGIILTANYPARAHGIKAAMLLSHALQLYPKLIVREPNFKLYRNFSETFFDFLQTYSDKIEKASIDEAYIDVTENKLGLHPIELAKHMMNNLYKIHKLPSSIGIAPTKFLAKMASDMKKPMGITIFRKRELNLHLWNMDIEKFHGIGKSSYSRFHEIDVHLIGDIVKHENKDKIIREFGESYFLRIFSQATGESSNNVDPLRKAKNASLGNSRTFIPPLLNFDDIKANMLNISNLVYKRIYKIRTKPKTLVVQLQYQDENMRSKSTSIKDIDINDERDIFYISLEVLDELYDELNHKDVRLLGISFTNFENEKVSKVDKEYNLFNYHLYSQDGKVGINVEEDIEGKVSYKIIEKK